MAYETVSGESAKFKTENAKMLINVRVIHFLLNAHRKQRLASAIMFHGPRGVGKFATALNFASSLLSPNRKLIFPHPDIKIILPTPKDLSEDKSLDRYGELVNSLVRNPHAYFPLSGSISIPIRAIRDLRSWLGYSAMVSGLKVAVIVEAQRMTTEAQNAFLKSLEEPPDNSYIILTSSSPSELLPTIRSRVQGILFEPISEELIADYLVRAKGADRKRAEFIAGLADGSLTEAINLMVGGEERETHIRLLQCLLASDELETIKFIQQKGELDISHFLIFFLSFLRDAIVLKETGEEGHIINKDIMSIVRDASSAFATDELSEYFGRVRQAIGFLESYPNYQLLILSLHRRMCNLHPSPTMHVI